MKLNLLLVAGAGLALMLGLALSVAEARQLAHAEDLPPTEFGTHGLERLKYNNPGLVVDLGVGLWELKEVESWDAVRPSESVASTATIEFTAAPEVSQRSYVPEPKPSRVLSEHRPRT